MKKNYIEFACIMHGYLIRTKEIHWATESNATHKICDEILDELEECEDRFMESAMGLEDAKFPVGKLLPLLPNSTTLNGMLKELEKDALDIRKQLKSEKEEGLVNVVGDLIEIVGKFKYRATQK